jgi:hypothetical protein
MLYLEVIKADPYVYQVVAHSNEIDFSAGLLCYFLLSHTSPYILPDRENGLLCASVALVAFIQSEFLLVL